MNFGAGFTMAKAIEAECEKIIDNFDIKKLSEKRVLITGGTGFIGYYTVIIFLFLNDIYHAKIQFLLSVRDYEKAKMIFSGILNRDDVHLLVQDLSRDLAPIEGTIDFIIHLANTSEVSALRKLGHTDVFNTIKGTENLLRLAEEKKTEAFLYLSSVTVYGEEDGQEDITEEQYFSHNWLKENAAYVNIKRMSESLLKLSSLHSSVRTVLLRPAFVYGFNPFPDERIYAKALLQASLGKNIELQSSGYLYRDSVYVIDLVMAMFRVLQFGEFGEAYNVSGGVISLRSYIDIICAISGVKGIYGKGDDVYRVRYYKKYNTKKIESLGYTSHFTHEDAIKSSLNIGRAWLGREKS